MEDFKVLHIADIHAKDDEIAEVKKCLAAILEIAESERPNCAIIAGDTFDNQQVRLDSLAAKRVFNFVYHLSHICPVIIGIGTTSHDGQTVEVLNSLNNVYCSAAPVQLFYSEMDHGLYHEMRFSGAPLAVFSVLPAPTKKYLQGDAGIEDADKTIAASMSAIFAGLGASAPAGVPHILVGHWNTVGAMKSESQIMPGNDIEISYDQMMLANPDLVCLGHIHMRQRIGDRAFYAGSIYRKDFGEMEEKGVYVHTLRNAGVVSSRFINTPTRKLWKCEINLTGDNGIESFPARLEAEIKRQGRPEDGLVRCTIKCWADEADLLNLETIKQFFDDCGAKEADVRRLRTPRAAVRGESVLTAHSLPDKLTSMATIRGEAIAPGHREKAQLLETETPDRIIAMITGPAHAERAAA